MNDYPTNNLNTEAYGTGTIDWSTNMPNPAHDLDDDNRDARWEEAEVTADSSSFPNANYGYIYNQEFTRWYGMPPYWFWDSGAGTIAHLSQMSYWLIEWQAADWTSIYWNTSYPSKAAPSGAAESIDAAPASTAGQQATMVASSGTRSALAAHQLAVVVDTSGSETDIMVTRPRDVGWREYVEGGHARALAAMNGTGPYEVVVTFSRPLSAAELSEVVSVSGFALEEFEAIGVRNGHTWTYGGGAGGINDVADRAATDGVGLLGFVTVTGLISGPEAYEVLGSSASVLLVDLAPTLARQLAIADADMAAAIGTDAIDLLVNDVYWDYAGLTQ
jgi:hypothetical protein